MDNFDTFTSNEGNNKPIHDVKPKIDTKSKLLSLSKTSVGKINVSTTPRINKKRKRKSNPISIGKPLLHSKRSPLYLPSISTSEKRVALCQGTASSPNLNNNKPTIATAFKTLPISKRRYGVVRRTHSPINVVSCTLWYIENWLIVSERTTEKGQYKVITVPCLCQMPMHSSWILCLIVFLLQFYVLRGVEYV